MFNFDEIWAHLKQPGKIAKLRALGDIFQYLLSWVALGAVALVGDQVGAWTWLYASLTVVLLTTLGKHAFNNTKYGMRPDGGDDSMPSGHTSGAFGGAAFIHFMFGLEWALVPYALASLVALSRVLSKRHYVRDVVAGALLAISVMSYFIHVGVPSFLYMP